MNCSHCGAKMEKGFQYCPVCGTKADTTIKSDPKSDDEPQSAPIIHKKKMPVWFKVMTFLAILALVGVAGLILFTEKFVDVVNHHLEALRSGDVEKAYSAYTSKEFQASTSLTQFQNFLENYPVFLNNQSAHFIERYPKNNHAVLKGNLTSKERVNTPIEYRLIKEGDKWKILTIRLRKPNLIPHAKGMGHADELVDQAMDQLSLIREDKLDQVYEKYSSREFRQATPENDFIEFINRYPVLKTYETITFPKATVRNGVGTLGAILKEKDVEAYLKYYFIKEDQMWKILSMRVLSAAEESIEEPIEYGDITLGSEIDNQGMVKNPSTVFNSNLKNLYINLDIENGLKDEAVNFVLQHLESGLTIPAKVIIPKNGDTMLVSTFTPPEKGWLKGKYRLKASSSSGTSKTTEFKIE